MTFTSYGFLGFFPLVAVIYYTLPSSMRRIWLLIANYFFYMIWNVFYGILLLVVITLAYVSGLVIEKTASDKKKKNSHCLFTSICSFGQFTRYNVSVARVMAV